MLSNIKKFKKRILTYSVYYFFQDTNYCTDVKQLKKLYLIIKNIDLPKADVSDHQYFKD